MFKTAPLSSSFMMISLLGFIISAFLLTDPVVMSWAFAFMIVFIVMFISSVISMSNAPINEFTMEELGFHRKPQTKKVIVYPESKSKKK